MDYLKNVTYYKNGALIKGDVSVGDGCALDGDGLFVFPGFADVHTHLREPGFSYKETIRTGTRAAARGGYTAICSMPNVEPPPDSMDGLLPQLGLIQGDAAIRVYPHGTITRGRKGRALSDMADLAPYVRAFSDDGSGVRDEALMRAAMLKAKSLGRLIAAHCEDENAPPEESEWRELRRDLALVRETGCAFHVCHVSKKESIELIRAAKAEGLDVSCETAPHYLLLDNTMLKDDGRFKMNPPIGSGEDRAALLAALADGTIDMIATDHAPHSAAEKAGGFAKSANGVSGLECAFSVLYTSLVLTSVITLPKLIELMSVNPSRRFRLASDPGDLCVFDLDTEFCIDPSEFLSMGKSTPFEGMRVRGRCLLTLADGEKVWEDKEYAKKN
ncbi:MAG: dihydroorotase [Oscillospiraceae bacterium]